MKPSRRNFLSATGVSAVATLSAKSLLLGLQRASATETSDSAMHPIAVFAKHVQSLSSDELGRRLKDIGVQGIEATLRKGGKIDPANLSQELEGLCEALAKNDQKILIAASDVNQVNSESEAYLHELARQSVPHFRMAYYRYDFNKPLLPQLDAFARQAEQLAELCKDLKIKALYQNHAGRRYVGAAVWDLRHVLSQVSPKHLAVALDIRHTTLELSQSYEAGYQAIRDHIGAIYVKDFEWIDGTPLNVPLGKGRSKPLFDLILRDGLVGPLSLHMEYTDHNDPSQTEASWKAIEADVKTLQAWLA